MASARLVGVVRHFSTSSVRAGKLVTAPIHLYGVEGRYAHALYSAASKQNNLDAVDKEIKGFQDVMAKDPKVNEYLRNPTISRREKRETMSQITTKLKYSDVTKNVFEAMAEHGRLNKVTSIMKAFGKIMSAHRGDVTITVTTAKALSAGNEKELRAALQAFLKKGETVQLFMEVDANIVGGMIVDIGGEKYIDMSTASKLNTYTKLIKEAV